MKTSVLFKFYSVLHYSIFLKENKQMYETTFDKTVFHIKNIPFFVFLSE